MADSVQWPGQSGTNYPYHVFKMPWNPAFGEVGNYIFAKVVNRIWQPIYIGHGNLKDRHKAAIDEGCVTQKGATHFHAHLEEKQDVRRSEERDLIAGHPVCRAPNGCNERG